MYLVLDLDTLVTHQLTTWFHTDTVLLFVNVVPCDTVQCSKTAFSSDQPKSMNMSYMYLGTVELHLEFFNIEL